MAMTSVSIIGAGPAGSYSAYLLARAGFDVSVFEEHPIVGEPWACTGVITEDVLSRQLKLPEELVVNRIEKARIISPDNNFIEVKLKNDVVIDRAVFDQHVAEMAKNEGAKYYVNHRFVEICGNGESDGKVTAKIRNKNLNQLKGVESDWLIGADGPRSEVARSAGIFGNRKFYVGSQVTAKMENDNLIRFYPSENGIAWTVPENSRIVRAGIAANKNASGYFDEFMTQAVGKDYRQRIIARQAGPIPVYSPKAQTQKGRILLAGDAATMVKATTLGGINQSLMAATAVAEAIATGKDYSKLWKKKLGRDLWLSLMMRKAMNRFSDNDYNKLVKIFGSSKNKKMLEEFDRDEPRKFAFKLLLQEPRLLLLSRRLLF